MAGPVSHQLDIYGAWLHVATDRKAWASLRRTVKNLPNLSPGSIGYTSRDVTPEGEPHLSLFIDNARFTDNDQGRVEIIAHEAYHASAMLMDHIEQDYDGESEHLAYLVGFIAAFVWEACAA